MRRSPMQTPPEPPTPSDLATRPSAARSARLARLREAELDVLIVGGGITGAGLAQDLGLRGLSVGLVERDDWAAATSSASSRLVHGGLRYLEQFAFGLVRESCLERGLLLRNAAGLVWPEQFLFPVRKGDRVGLAKLAAGLGLYTAVSLPRALGLPRLFGKATVRRRLPAIDRRGLRGGGSYHDGATDDARLCRAIVESALTAGAHCLSRVELETLDPSAQAGAAARLVDRIGGERFELRARAVVLAGGPFTEGLRARAGLSGRWVEPTRGTHIVVPRERLPTDGAVIFPSAIDGRVMFLIPWPRYTTIGTTDLDADADAPVRATRAEVQYLLDSANALAPVGLTEDDVVSTWAGLRPLLAAPGEDPSARSREERVVREGPIYTIAGGKLTGYRAMAEGLAARLTSELDRGQRGRRSPTRDARLPGAFEAPVARPRWSWLDEDGDPLALDPLATAWSRRYAARADAVARRCAADEALPGGSTPLDPETRLGEVDWAVEREDCLGAVDFFLRRTDLGYGPRSTAEAAAKPVLERLATRLQWSPERRQAEQQALDEALQGLHGWRDEG